MSVLTDLIEKKIKVALPHAEVRVWDPQNDGQHLEAEVLDPSFRDISRVKQHQIVMSILKEDFSTRLHALRLKTGYGH